MRVASPAPGIHITARPVVCSGVDRPEIIDRYLLEITHQEFQFCWTIKPAIQIPDSLRKNIRLATWKLIGIQLLASRHGRNVQANRIWCDVFSCWEGARPLSFAVCVGSQGNLSGKSPLQFSQFFAAHLLDALPERSDVNLVNQNLGNDSDSLRWKRQFQQWKLFLLKNKKSHTLFSILYFGAYNKMHGKWLEA